MRSPKFENFAKSFMAIFVILFFSKCNPQQETLVSLQTENSMLRKELDSLQKVSHKKVGFVLPGTKLYTDNEARPFIVNYRSQMSTMPPPLGSYGIWYAKEAIADYLKTFDELITKMPPKKPVEAWVIGFYWMSQNNPKNVQEPDALENSFFMVPTLIDTSNSSNIVFYDYFNSKYYNKYHLASGATPKTGGGNSTDNGQMWP